MQEFFRSLMETEGWMPTQYWWMIHCWPVWTAISYAAITPCGQASYIDVQKCIDAIGSTENVLKPTISRSQSKWQPVLNLSPLSCCWYILRVTYPAPQIWVVDWVFLVLRPLSAHIQLQVLTKTYHEGIRMSRHWLERWTTPLHKNSNAVKSWMF